MGLGKSFKRSLGGGIVGSLVNPVFGGIAGALGGSKILKALGMKGGSSGTNTNTYPMNEFEDLASSEELKRQQFGDYASGEILSERDKLVPFLQEQARKQFEVANPYILEDLNSRGFLSSPSEVARAQTSALNELNVLNSDRLTDLTTGALSARLQGRQDAMDTGLGLRGKGIEFRLGSAQANADRDFSKNLASKQRKNDLWGSLIGAGGSIFGGLCFDEMTPITMADGSVKPICEFLIDDETKGGRVISVRIAKTPDGTLYSYKGEILTGSHAVKEETEWIRVEDSPRSHPLDGERIVYCLITTDHRIFVNGIEFADEVEVESDAPLSLEESLVELNRRDFSEVSTNGVRAS